jgi:hypothetical protein
VVGDHECGDRHHQGDRGHHPHVLDVGRPAEQQQPGVRSDDAGDQESGHDISDTQPDDGRRRHRSL